MGVGLSYKPVKAVEVYGNVSQNYRSVTFNDIRITNPSLVVDPNITDEKGYTFDLGARGRIGKHVSYDVGGFFLSYENRLGVIVREVSDIQESVSEEILVMLLLMAWKVLWIGIYWKLLMEIKISD